jgi:hypothetical protein
MPTSCIVVPLLFSPQSHFTAFTAQSAQSIQVHCQLFVPSTCATTLLDHSLDVPRLKQSASRKCATPSSPLAPSPRNPNRKPPLNPRPPHPNRQPISPKFSRRAEPSDQTRSAPLPSSYARDTSSTSRSGAFETHRRATGPRSWTRCAARMPRC